MKDYLKPSIEVIELEFAEEIMGGNYGSGGWGVEDGEDDGWED